MRIDAIRTLMDVCLLIVDCPHSTAMNEGDGHPLIRTPNIGRGRFILAGVHRVSEEVYQQRNMRATPQNNDLILAREAPAGNVAIIRNDSQFCLGQRTVLIRPNPIYACPDYLNYYLLAPQQQQKLLKTANGATVTHINLPDIRNLRISLPSMKTQNRISNILSTYDDAIENNNRRISLLEKAARELYREWFVRMRFPGHEDAKFANGLPEGWEVKRLKDISDFKYGTMPNAEKVKESGYPIFSGYRVTGYYDEYMFEQEQLVLIARGVGGTGEVRLSPPFCYLTNLSIAFLLKDDVFKLYLYEMFRLQNLRYLDTGAAQSQITIGNLERCKIIVPAIDLLKKYSQLSCESYELKLALENQSQNLARQRDLLLPRLMSGKLEM